MIFIYILISILFATQIFIIVKLFKENKKQKTINKTFEKNQITLSNNISSLNICLQKAANNIEKQYDNIKKVEMTLVQKVNPLLDKNQITDELRRKLNDSERTVNDLRSTIIQMSNTFKRMQKAEKQEHEKETVKKRKSKINNNQ